MTRKYMIVGIALIVVTLIVVTPSYVVAQDTLTFSLLRNNGIGLGSTIQGTFTLNGVGPEAIIGLIVYFNGDVVQSVSGNTISWQFETGDYPAGETNITLYGWDNLGIDYVSTQTYSFMSDTMSSVFTFGIIALVVALVAIRYVPRLLGRSKKDPKTSAS